MKLAAKTSGRTPSLTSLLANNATEYRPYLDDLTPELKDLVLKNLDCMDHARMSTSTKHFDWERACRVRGWVPLESPDISWRIQFAKKCIVSTDNEDRSTAGYVAASLSEWSLAKAVAAGHRGKVEVLLAGVGDLGAEYGYLLYLATARASATNEEPYSERKTAEVVKLLLQMKRRQQSRDNVDPRAASAPHAETVSDGEYEGIAMCFASFRGHIDVVKVLIEANVDVDASDYGFGDRFAGDSLNHPEINRAEFMGQIKTTKFSMALPYFHGRHTYGSRPVCYASKNGLVDVVQLLITAGADIDLHDYSALEAASKGGSVDVVKLLLKSGVDVSARDDMALYFATSFGHSNVVKLLIDATTKVNPWSSLNTRCVYRQIRMQKTIGMACHVGNLDTLKMLLALHPPNTPAPFGIIDMLRVALRNNSTDLYPLLNQMRIDQGIPVPEFLRNKICWTDGRTFKLFN